AAQIVTGIGFIGAGLIFREGYTVRGITTAATIWAAAAMGMAVGMELYIVAVACAVLLFAVLEARPLTRRFERAIAPREEGLWGALTPDNEDGDEQITDED
ncbi:MAG TPA: MgtC/SapB family protein, partial [Dehalococcoidia bacterium]